MERGLAYVLSAGFADAMPAVVEGRSRHSVPETPESWIRAAREWRNHLVAHEVHGPSLVEGNGNAAVVYPCHVPMATHDLAASIEGYQARIHAIGAIVSGAEKPGRVRCLPAEVDAAKAMLEEASRRVASQADGAGIDIAFDRAEEAAYGRVQRDFLYRSCAPAVEGPGRTLIGRPAPDAVSTGCGRPRRRRRPCSGTLRPSPGAGSLPCAGDPV